MWLSKYGTPSSVLSYVRNAFSVVGQVRDALRLVGQMKVTKHGGTDEGRPQV